MSVEESYNYLGLEFNSDIKEVNKKWRQLSKLSHSDKGGTDEAQTKLNDAKSTILSYLSNNSKSSLSITKQNEIILKQQEQFALILKNQEQTAIINLKEKEKQALTKINDATFIRVSRIKQSKLKDNRQISIFLGGLSTLIGVISTTVKSVLPTNNELLILCMVLAATCGGFFLFINQKIEKVQSQIDDIKELVEDKSVIYAILTCIFFNAKSKRFDKRELEDEITEWLFNRRFELPRELRYLHHETEDIRQLGKFIGERDFSKIIINKSIEHEIINYEKANITKPYTFNFIETLDESNTESI